MSAKRPVTIGPKRTAPAGTALSQLAPEEQYTADEVTSVVDAVDDHADRIDGQEQNYVNASTWILNHGLDTYPVVVCLNAIGQLLSTPVEYPTRNRVQIEFTTPQSGSMRIV